MLKIKHYRTERLSLFSALDICRKWGFYRIYILFQHRELKALFIFFHHLPPTSIHLKALFMNKKQIINN